MSISRRDFMMAALSAYAGVYCCTPNVTAQFPKKQTDLVKDVPRTPSKWSYNGCSLFGTAEVTAAIGNGGFGTSTGIPALDAGLDREIIVLKNYFGVNPAVYTYQDGNSPNAFATTERIGNHPFRDGTVALGTTLVKSLLDKFRGTSQISMGDHAVVGVLAHEFGHIGYFKAGGPRLQQVKPSELHADFLAGWYTGIRAVQLPGQVNLQESAKQMFDIGDTNFNDPNHHGTSQERLSAYVAGVNLSVNSRATVTYVQAFQQASRFVGLSAQNRREVYWQLIDSNRADQFDFNG